MKAVSSLLAAILLSGAAGAALAADPVAISPQAYAVKTPVDTIVTVVPAPAPTAVVVERMSVYSLLDAGWTPVSAAIIPESGVPGTRGAFAHVNGEALRLYKGGVYADCGIARVGGLYNDCRIVTPGTR